MKKLLLFFTLYFPTLAIADEAPLPPTQPATPKDGYTIMKTQDDMDTGFHDQVSIGHMILKGSGASAEREFESRALEKTATEGHKALIKFIKPADIQGTALLSFQNKDRDDDQWLYLPSLKKTKRISGTGKSGSFVGSEFSYEDMVPLAIDKYSYQYLRDEPCADTTCYVIDSIPKATDSGYSKITVWVRQDNNQTVKSDFYDKKGRLLKTAVFEQWQLLNGKFWRAFQITIKNAQNGRETILTLQNIKIQSGLGPNDFTEMALER